MKKLIKKHKYNPLIHKNISNNIFYCEILPYLTIKEILSKIIMLDRSIKNWSKNNIIFLYNIFKIREDNKEYNYAFELYRILNPDYTNNFLIKFIKDTKQENLALYSFITPKISNPLFQYYKPHTHDGIKTFDKISKLFDNYFTEVISGKFSIKLLKNIISQSIYQDKIPEIIKYYPSIIRHNRDINYIYNDNKISETTYSVLIHYLNILNNRYEINNFYEIKCSILALKSEVFALNLLNIKNQNIISNLYPRHIKDILIAHKNVAKYILCGTQKYHYQSKLLKPWSYKQIDQIKTKYKNEKDIMKSIASSEDNLYVNFCYEYKNKYNIVQNIKYHKKNSTNKKEYTKCEFITPKKLIKTLEKKLANKLSKFQINKFYSLNIHHIAIENDKLAIELLRDKNLNIKNIIYDKYIIDIAMYNETIARLLFLDETNYLTENEKNLHNIIPNLHETSIAKILQKHPQIACNILLDKKYETIFEKLSDTSISSIILKHDTLLMEKDYIKILNNKKYNYKKILIQLFQNETISLKILNINFKHFSETQLDTIKRIIYIYCLEKHQNIAKIFLSKKFLENNISDESVIYLIRKSCKFKDLVNLALESNLSELITDISYEEKLNGEKEIYKKITKNIRNNNSSNLDEKIFEVILNLLKKPITQDSSAENLLFTEYNSELSEHYKQHNTMEIHYDSNDSIDLISDTPLINQLPY